MLSSFGSLLDRVLRWLYAACAVLAGCAIVTIALAVAVSIASRALGIYVPGTTEIAGYGMAAAGSLGLASTAINHGHIRVDLVLSRLRHRPRQRVEIAAAVATTVAIGFASWALIRLVSSSHRYGDLSSNSDGLPLWLPQMPLAVGFVVFTVALLHLAVLTVLGRNPAPVPVAEGPQP